MEACFLSSNSFTKTTEIIPFNKARVHTYAGRTFCQNQSTRVAILFSISSCQLGPKSPSPEDEDRPLVDFDWRSFRARLVAGEKVSRPQESSSIIDPDAAVDQPTPITIGDKWLLPNSHGET